MFIRSLNLKFIPSIMLLVVGLLGVSLPITAAGPIGGPLTIRPLSDITADGPRLVNINPTHATLELTTTIPVACSIIYGPDRTYGQIAVDPDMAGAAIIDHRPIMGNLEPNTTYHYRLQGSDANGTLYVSELFTFATPGAPAQDLNLAALEQGAIVLDVSSNWANGSHDSSFGANKAIDNDENSQWASNGDGNHASIQIQLSHPDSVHAIAVWSREMNDGTSRVIAFTVTSDQNEQFRFTLPDARESYRFDTPFTKPVTWLRLDVDDSTGGNVGLRDFDVYATITP